MVHGNGKILIKEAIIVEGRYDKAKVSRLFDTVIVETFGFGIFSDNKRLALIRSLAKKCGIIILTDSDSAGFMIRNYIKGSISEGVVKHAYIPDIPGKERRKTAPSAEGNLGVEGIPDKIITDAVLSAGADKVDTRRNEKLITKLDLYEDGLNGRPDSSAKRKILLKTLNLPEHLSVNALCDVLNTVMSFEEYKKIIEKINE